MTDRLDAFRRSRLMQKVKTKDTGPEKQVRSLLHKLGYRFRLHRKGLPGTPDIVFSSRRVVIFVHGCFWHSHGCRKGQPPKSRHEYWIPKLQANRERDKRNTRDLVLSGWHVEVVWQCELSAPDELIKKLDRLLSQPTPGK
jgi:DNA mismatch endonuclease (patch repair protein)